VAVKSLINHRLALERSKAELEDFLEELPGDGGRLWSMHHHDRAALGIEFEPEPEDKGRIGVSATPMRMVINRMRGTCNLRCKLD
jgi:hypothetical protein